jgi:hypothetical protein
MGLAILKTWNFPAPLINKLATLRLVSKAGPGPEAKLRKIIDGAARFSRGLINQNLTGPELERQKEKLCQSLGLKPELFADSLTASVSRFQELAKILKVNLKDLGFTLAPAPGETPKAPAAGDQAPAKPAKTAAPPLSPEDQEVQNLRFLYQVMEEINQALVDKAPINQVISLVMEGIFRGIGFDRVILCLVNPQRTMVLGRFGLGEQADHLIKLLRLPLNSKKNALALSLAERREVLACPQSRLADRQLMEDGFWLASNCQTFLVTPIFVDQAPIGLLYMDRCTAKASISELDRHRVRTFRDLAILALRMSTGTNAGA